MARNENRIEGLVKKEMLFLINSLFPLDTFTYRIKLNRYPTIRIPVVTIPTKARIN